MIGIPLPQIHTTHRLWLVRVSLILLLSLVAFGCAQKGQKVPSLTLVEAVAAGGYHTCAVTDAGGVKCWGGNAYGQLGDGSSTQRHTPVDVVGLTADVKAITAGGPYTCALTTAGGVKCWGRNYAGQLGDGTETPSNIPVEVVGLTSGVKAIAGGGHHSCALTEVGGIKCWGSNDSRQVGDGTTRDRHRPVDVVGLTRGVRAVATGEHHTCAITEAGGVKCWGDNDSGQLGDGTKKERGIPVDVVGLASGAQMIAAGGNHTCILTNEGGVQCWGDNTQGQLGNAQQTNSAVPVNVAGLMKGVTKIAAGVGSVRELEVFVGAHTCALTVTGGVKCWGDNDDGQLGEGRAVERDTIVDVLGLASGVKAIAAGAHHSCALTTAGQVKCWGDNSQGQLGNGTSTNSPIPVDVLMSSHGQDHFTASYTPRTQ